MTYCSKQDLINAFGAEEIIALTDRGYNAVINDVVLNAALIAADAEINIWVAGSYALPLASVPTVLNRIACNITRYILAGDVEETSRIAQRYQQDLKTLQAIARGHASLGLDQSSVETERIDMVQIAVGRNDFGDRSAW